MSGITIFKLFWADQDQEQEQWLRDMARQGLHLKNVNIICRWTFVKGESADIAYRLDFNDKGSNSAYHRLFQDAGWEHVAELTGWQYWRKPVVDGQASEIFTDSESKVGKYRRVLAMLAMASMPMPLLLLISDKEQIAQDLSHPLLILVIGIVAVAIPLYTYAAIRLFKRIRNVRSAGA